MIKPAKVTRWATDLIVRDGFVNRLTDDPDEAWIKEGFYSKIVPRQVINYLFYNHGENLNYAMQYLNAPPQLAKLDLPLASEHPGEIYFVSDEKQTSNEHKQYMESHRSSNSGFIIRNILWQQLNSLI